MGLALKKEIVNPKTVIIGLGETGLSVARYLFQQDTVIVILLNFISSWTGTDKWVYQFEMELTALAPK